MTPLAPVLPLLVFEAADCLMAVLASEVSQLEQRGFLEKRGREPFSPVSIEKGSRPLFVDLGEYFGGRESDGPWLRWVRGTTSAWLRVLRVIDVVPVTLTALTPMPAILMARQRSRAFLAAGLRDDEMFLLLDPARLTQ